MTTQKLNGLSITGVLTAFTASLCCITPVLALVAGTSGIASAFSWVEPIRPWLMGLTLIVLGLAWYQKLKPTKISDIDCGCEKDDLAAKAGKPSFFQSKRFLGIVTVFVVLMLAFPAYADIFFPKHEKETTVVDKNSIVRAEFKIDGMTCTGCEAHVEHEVDKLSGIITVKASYEKNNTIVEYDPSLTSIDSIKAAIKATGYHIHSIN